MLTLTTLTRMVITIGLAYGWVVSPWLKPWSLQVFSLTVIGFIVLHQSKHRRWLTLTPYQFSNEVSLFTFGLLLLLGTTGNLHSPFYVLSYLHLFLLVMSLDQVSLFISLTLIIFFHASLTSQLTILETSNLLSLPLVTIFYLFAKRQLQNQQKSQKALHIEEVVLEQRLAKNQQLALTLDSIVTKRIPEIQVMAQQNPDSLSTMLKQMQETLNKISNLLKSA